MSLLVGERYYATCGCIYERAELTGDGDRIFRLPCPSHWLTALDEEIKSERARAERSLLGADGDTA